MYNAEQIVALLNTSDKAVERGIVAIYRRQTVDEQNDATTKHHNGMGFNARDARFGTYMAKYVLDGKPLTGKFLDTARKMTKRYVRQLVEVANGV
jgi:hypothetical protein